MIRSDESRRQKSASAWPEQFSGDPSAVDPPVPIPNTEVKRCSPDGSASIGCARVGRCQNLRPASWKQGAGLFLVGTRQFACKFYPCRVKTRHVSCPPRRCHSGRAIRFHPLDCGAGGGKFAASARALDALSELCQICWRSLYLFLRREGIGAEDAQDLTQGFFAKLIRDRTRFRVDREKGRFGSFLLGSLKHFVADERDREQAQKRGGGKIREPFDEATISEAESQVARNERWQADRVYDREWAETLLRQALARLAQECVFAGKAALFEALKSHLSPDGEEAVPYDELSVRAEAGGDVAQRCRKAALPLRRDSARGGRRDGD
jgi:DNA-directed RNA polymerase specialized sigma24 family protein